MVVVSFLRKCTILVFVALFGSHYYSNAQNWLLTGNAASSTSFIGTTNVQDFRMYTHNAQRMVIKSNGKVGIDTNDPEGKLDIYGTLMIHPKGVNIPDANGIYILQTDSISRGGDVKFLNVSSDTAWDLIQGENCGTGGNDLNFIFYPHNSTTCTNFVKTLTLSAGKVGIHASSSLTADLHVNGTVRFQNLPSGSGSNLVIDANGNVYRSTGALPARIAKNDSLTNRITELETELSHLKAAFHELEDKVEKGLVNNSPSLLQNYPNPYTEQTSIAYYLPKRTRNASILIFDGNGKEIGRAKLSKSGRGTITLANMSLPSGMYLYSLVVNGKVMDTKKMIVAR